MNKHERNARRALESLIVIQKLIGHTKGEDCSLYEDRSKAMRNLNAALQAIAGEAEEKA